MDKIKYKTGAAIRSYEVVDIISDSDWEKHTFILNMTIDTGYTMRNVPLEITRQDVYDLMGEEPEDISEVVKYVLGFYDED